MIEDVLTIIIIFVVLLLAMIIRSFISDVMLFNREWRIKKGIKPYLVITIIITIVVFIILKIQGFEFPYF